MSMEYIQVAEEEGDEPIELPIEEDKTMLLSTVQSAAPGSCGLKYRNPENRAIRGLRVIDGRIHPPNQDGWGTHIYFCVFPKENKRKSDDNLENSTAKTKRIEKIRCSDLIVLGLPWKTTEKSLRDYFEQFGEVLMAQIKKDINSGQSKGFGFIRFASYDSQARVLVQRHLIDGRWCEVKVPNSKEGAVQQVPCKVFVGRCTEDLTAEDLRSYFTKFGEVTDVFIPKPFRAFSFVTFLDPEVAQSLCGEDHIIKGVSVHVSNAAPKSEPNRSHNNQSSQNNNNNNNNNGNSSNLNSNNAGASNNNNNPQHSAQHNPQHNSQHNPQHSLQHNPQHNPAISHNHNSMQNPIQNNLQHQNNNVGPLVPTHHSRIGVGVAAINNVMSRPEPNNMSYQQNRGNYVQAQPIQHNNGGWNQQQQQQRGGGIDMPNLQALGINPQGQNPTNQGQNINNPLGVGLNLNALPMNPALVAAALNQWSLIGNLQNQQDQGGFGGSGGPPNPQPGTSQQTGGYLSWMSQGADGGQQGGGGGNQQWARQQGPNQQMQEHNKNYI